MTQTASDSKINHIINDIESVVMGPDLSAKLWMLVRAATAGDNLLKGKVLGNELINIFAFNPWLDQFEIEYSRSFEAEIGGHHSMTVSVDVRSVTASQDAQTTSAKKANTEAFKKFNKLFFEGEYQHFLEENAADIFDALNDKGQSNSTPCLVTLTANRSHVEATQNDGPLAVFAAIAPEAYLTHRDEMSWRFPKPSTQQKQRST